MFLFAAVIVFPFLSAALVPVASIFGKKTREVFAVVCGFITAALVILLIPQIRMGTGVSVQWLPGINIGVNLDAMSVNIAVIAGTIGSLIVLYSTKYMEKEEGGLRYYSLLLLFIAGMIGLVLSDNFLTLYVCWEIVGVCSYALIGFFYKDPKAVKAGIKAFITTRVGDIGLLVGILLLYLYTNTFNISEIMKGSAQIPGIILAIAGFGFMLGAIGKSAQVPLHVWLPDAMEAPTTISALIHAATMVNAGVYLMARTYPLFAPVAGWTLTLTWVGAITALLAASMGLVENDLKKVLAYSTVSQLGFMMLAIGVGGIFASQFHLMSHAIFKALLFLSAGAIIHETGTRNMKKMGGLSKEMKITAVCFAAGALALMGIPILNGFFSKDLIFAAALSSGNIAPLIVGAIAAVFTILYSCRMFFLVFLGERKGSHVHDAPVAMTLPLVVLACASVVSWLIATKFNAALIMSGVKVEELHFAAFMKDIFLSGVTLVSLTIIVTGFAVYFARKIIMSVFGVIIGPFLWAASKGFGFDALYYSIINMLAVASAAVLTTFDEGILNAANYGVGSVTMGFSKWFRRSHTGELNMNLAGMVLGLAAVIVILFWWR